MYSFNYLGCVSFTTANLTKGGQFSIMVSSLSTALNPFGEYGTVAEFTFGEFDCGEWKTRLVCKYIYTKRDICFCQGTITVQLDCC